jgi:hypothetical protein
MGWRPSFLYELCASLPNSTAKQPRKSRDEQEQTAFAAGMTMFHLSSYSPEQSGIGLICQDVKHREMTQRRYNFLGPLFQGGDDALARKAENLMAAHTKTDHPIL